MLPQLLRVISQAVTLSAPDADQCAQAFQPLNLKKNTVVEWAGEVPRHLYWGFSLQRDTVGEFIFKPLLEALIAQKRPDGSGPTAPRLTS